MSDSKTERKLVAPYPAWPTFRGFLRDLASKGTPSRIDHTVMVGKSGSAQSAIRKALQFLKLTDTQNTPTAQLRRLLGALDSEEWQDTLRPIILDAYAPITVGLDLENGTAQQLADCFRKRGNVSGNTLTMAVRFFLGALSEAGVKRSTYFVAPPRPPTKKGVAAKAAKTDVGQAGHSGRSGTRRDDDPPSIGNPESKSRWPSQPLFLPTRSEPILIQAPKDLSLAEWQIIDAFYRGMIGLRESEAPPPSVDTENGG